ncbi:MAG: tRNA1(Val) (adenine(37)-N6)-methyltransferase [Qingshengfaniella sp.]
MDDRGASETRDRFLGGRLIIAQPAVGFRAGVDAVLLAAAVPAAPGQSALDLGCGVGTAALCLGCRVPEIALTGLEVQPGYAALARANATDNGIALTVLTGDLADPPAELRARSFDHVFANPPYFQRQSGSAATDSGRETAFADGAPLALWVDAATRRLRPGGYLTMIERIERLPDLLAALDGRMGGIRILPLAPRAGRAPKLFLLRARKGARGAFALLPPLTLHQGARHQRDGDDYTPDVAAVLRDAAPLPWPEPVG